MSYHSELKAVAEKISAQCDCIFSLEKGRQKWVSPENERVSFGQVFCYVVRKDGTVTPGLETVQAEMLKVFDNQLFKAKSKLEGLRFELVQLGKKGGAA